MIYPDYLSEGLERVFRQIERHWREDAGAEKDGEAVEPPVADTGPARPVAGPLEQPLIRRDLLRGRLSGESRA